MICALTGLQVLAFRSNAFTTVLPLCLSRLRQLQLLDVTSSRQTGNISFLEGMTMLTSFVAPSNNYNGTMLQYHLIPKSLVLLDLTANSIQGSLPAWFGNLTMLRTLLLARNQFSGSLPVSLFQLPNLATLRLEGNSFSGALPTNISGLLSMVVCDLTGNRFAGQLPDGFESLAVLASFSAGDNAFTGQPPPSLFNVSTLSSLDLSFNDLTGTLPPLCGLIVVRFLVLDFNAIGGVLPFDIGCLSYLSVLSAPHNQLAGTIPPSLWRLHNLSFVDLSWNNLSGDIVQGIAKLPALWYLDLSRNSLSGDLSFLQVLTGLWFLNLVDNSLSGDVLSWLISSRLTFYYLLLGRNALDGCLVWNATFPQLRTLYLSYNHLCGSLPTNVSQFLPSVVFLALDFNMVSGPVPTTLPVHGTLLANNNQLSGDVPLLSLASLAQVELGNNKLTGNFSDLYNVTNTTVYLRKLALNGNQMVGPLPIAWGAFVNLNYLDLSDNLIGGSFPSTLFSDAWWVSEVYLGGNLLTGTVPASFFFVPWLKALNVSHNMLSGVLPEISNAVDLKSLCLSHNQFEGALPASWGSLVSLASISIGHNLVQGTIPSTWSQLASLTVLDLGYSANLTGNVSTFLLSGNYSILTELSLSANRFYGEIPFAIGTLSPLLSVFRVDNNNISGTIPPSLGQLHFLSTFNVSVNALHGTIGPLWSAASLNSSSAMVVCDMSRNALGGTIPFGFLEMAANLTVLDISSNSVAGPLPFAWFRFSSLSTLNLGSNPLRGALPRSWARFGVLTSLDLAQTNLSGTLPPNWGDDGNLASLLTFRLGGSFCTKVPYTWLQRPVLASALAGVTYSYCSATVSGDVSHSGDSITSSRTFSTNVTESRNYSRSLSVGVSRTWSTARSHSRTAEASGSATERSYRVTSLVSTTQSQSGVATVTREPLRTGSLTFSHAKNTVTARLSCTNGSDPLLSHSSSPLVTRSMSLSNSTSISTTWTAAPTVSAQVVPTPSFVLDVEPTPASPVVAAGASAAVVTAGVLSSIVSSGFSSTVQLIQIGKSTRQMLLAACSNTNTSLVSPEAPYSDWMDNPLRIQASHFPAELRSAGGAILGNSVLMIAVLLIRCSLAIAYDRLFGARFRWSVRHFLVRWPSCVSVPLEPSLSAAVFLLVSSSRSPRTIAVGCTAIVVLATSIVVVHGLALQLVSRGAQAVPRPVIHSYVPRRLRGWATILSDWLRWLLREQWCWVAVGEGPCSTVQRDFDVMSVLFRSYRSPGALWTTVAELAWTIVCASALAVGTAAAGNCALCLKLTWLMFALSVVRTGLFVWVRPMSSRSENAEQCAMSGLNAALILFSIVTPTDGAGTNVLTFVELGLLVAKALFQIFHRVYLLSRRMHYRRPQVTPTDENVAYLHQPELTRLIQLICNDA